MSEPIQLRVKIEPKSSGHILFGSGSDKAFCVESSVKHAHVCGLPVLLDVNKSYLIVLAQDFSDHPFFLASSGTTLTNVGDSVLFNPETVRRDRVLRVECKLHAGMGFDFVFLTEAAILAYERREEFTICVHGESGGPSYADLLGDGKDEPGIPTPDPLPLYRRAAVEAAMTGCLSDTVVIANSLHAYVLELAAEQNDLAFVGEDGTAMAQITIRAKMRRGSGPAGRTMTTAPTLQERNVAERLRVLDNSLPAASRFENAEERESAYSRGLLPHFDPIVGGMIDPNDYIVIHGRVWQRSTLVATFQRMRINGVRLRWPNDLEEVSQAELRELNIGAPSSIIGRSLVSEWGDREFVRAIVALKAERLLRISAIIGGSALALSTLSLLIDVWLFFELDVSAGRLAPSIAFATTVGVQLFGIVRVIRRLGQYFVETLQDRLNDVDLDVELGNVAGIVKSEVNPKRSRRTPGDEGTTTNTPAEPVVDSQASTEAGDDDDFDELVAENLNPPPERQNVSYEEAGKEIAKLWALEPTRSAKFDTSVPMMPGPVFREYFLFPTLKEYGIREALRMTHTLPSFAKAFVFERDFWMAAVEKYYGLSMYADNNLSDSRLVRERIAAVLREVWQRPIIPAQYDANGRQVNRAKNLCRELFRGLFRSREHPATLSDLFAPDSGDDNAEMLSKHSVYEARLWTYGDITPTKNVVYVEMLFDQKLQNGRTGNIVVGRATIEFLVFEFTGVRLDLPMLALNSVVSFTPSSESDRNVSAAVLVTRDFNEQDRAYSNAVFSYFDIDLLRRQFESTKRLADFAREYESDRGRYLFPGSVSPVLEPSAVLNGNTRVPVNVELESNQNGILRQSASTMIDASTTIAQDTAPDDDAIPFPPNLFTDANFKSSVRTSSDRNDIIRFSGRLFDKTVKMVVSSRAEENGAKIYSVPLRYIMPSLLLGNFVLGLFLKHDDNSVSLQKIPTLERRRTFPLGSWAVAILPIRDLEQIENLETVITIEPE